MLKVTEMDTKERRHERIEVGVITDVIESGKVRVERYLPNGKLEELDLFCTAWDTAEPGRTCIDFQRNYSGGSSSCIRVVGYTPEDIAKDFLKDYMERSAIQ